MAKGMAHESAQMLNMSTDLASGCDVVAESMSGCWCRHLARSAGPFLAAFWPLKSDRKRIRCGSSFIRQFDFFSSNIDVDNFRYTADTELKHLQGCFEQMSEKDFIISVNRVTEQTHDE
ncbi:hypothetical protein F2P81_011817 [Scophthalmus maximus]|uniref:Uncharacterized protein n=1 Tax=Scophthalmus maximus TaxID=52904 RepID=A0A6A4SUZ3_SCOMX|nr:hypothetical protein F2P81_011817 [Scophthalmus maximus]